MVFSGDFPIGPVPHKRRLHRTVTIAFEMEIFLKISTVATAIARKSKT
jgi:hypothetical protein